ncbi:MAG: TA0938 family protein [Thermoplasmata archaeon]|nr:TA0938 family protein [Thermoplasmata archaeon]
MDRNYAGCAICDSTWGDVWEEVDGERMFFCCTVCARQFRQLVDRIKGTMGWSHLDAIEIRGDRRGRTCVARSGTGSLEVLVAFDSEGDLWKFNPSSKG